MRNVILIIILLVMSKLSLSQSISKSDVRSLLLEKGIQLEKLEAQGMRVFMGGEITGHGLKIQIREVQVFITQDEAVLKSEVQEINGGKSLVELESLLTKTIGTVDKSEIKAVLVK